MVYFVSNGEHIKIGKSRKPLNRIKELQTSNSNILKFIYLFDVKDKYEKTLHKLFKDFKTESNNEWFDLKGVDIEQIIKGSLRNIPQFLDFKQAEFKASQFNNTLNKSFEPKTNVNKTDVRLMLDEIRAHLVNKPNVRISYQPYILKYKFTKEEIAYFVKSAKLGKLIFKHNEKI